MLTTMRSGLNSFFVLFLLGLLISSFAIWGIGDIFTSRSASVATVGEKDISTDNFLREFQSRVQGYQAQFGPEFNTQQALSFGVQHMVLDEMISRTTLDEEARLLGLVGAPGRVVSTIKSMDVFKDASGNFSDFNYKQILAGAGLSPQTFEASLLTEHARSQLVEAIVSANPVPQIMVDTLYSFRKEKRRAKILNIQTSDVQNLSEPSETDLSNYYDQYQNYFMYPEYRELEFIVINPSDFAGEIEFSEDTLLEAYDERSAQYFTPESRDVNVLVLDDEATALSVYERTQGGETLAQVASDMFEYSAEDVSLGNTDYYNLELDYNEAAAERVFALENGAVSIPTQTMFGWHVFQVTNIVEAVDVQYSDVRAEIIEELSNIAGYEAVDNLIDGIQDAIGGGGDIEVILGETGLASISTEAIDRNGSNKAGQLSSTVEPLLAFLPTGFTALPGDELTLEAFGDGGYYLVQVNNVIAPEAKAYADVKQEVQARWYAQERLRLAGELANQTLLAARAGQSLDELSDDFNADIIETSILQRDQSRGNLEISRPIFDLIFSLGDGEIEMEKSSTDDGYLLVQLTLQSMGVPNADDQSYQELQTTLSEELANDLIIEYQKAVAENLGVEVNQKLVSDLFSGEGIYQNIAGRQ